MDPAAAMTGALATPSEGGSLRRVLGKDVELLGAADVARLRSGCATTLVDLGAGDGKRARALARSHPDWWVVGVDVNVDNLRGTARKAAAPAAKGGTPNVTYVWAPAEELPPVLAPVDEIHVAMPWGSLLRGLLRAEPAVLGSLAGCCRPGAVLRVWVNLHAWRPPVPEVDGLEEPLPERVLGSLAAPYAASGWHLDEAHLLGQAEIDRLGTSWSSRLGAARGSFEVVGFSATRRADRVPASG